MSNAIHPYWAPLKQAFEKSADPEVAHGAAAYMKHQSQFYGIKAPDRRLMLASFIKSHGLPESDNLIPIIHDAWIQPQREFQYAAMELLFRVRKKLPEEVIQHFEWMVINKSWWDTVDYIAPKLIGEHFKMFPQLRDNYITKWMNSSNFWLHRTCLLFQLKYKSRTDKYLLFNLATQLASEKEFFIRKAIGWALREYAKTNPQEVKSFVEHTPLSGLSRREAMKHLL